jgi:SsrA-binding protein
MAYEKVITENRKAYHDFEIEEIFEAGIELKGSEVKSVKMGKVSISEAFVHPKDGELYIYNMHISPYSKSHVFVPDPKRPRKLLLHRHEIDRIIGRITIRGYTAIPLKVIVKRGWIKVVIALAKGRKKYEKKEIIKERDIERAIRRGEL